MTDRYEKIRQALAMGPTPGPWTAKSHAAPRADNGDIGIINGKGMLVAVAYSNTCTRGNASLIAACDPDTTSALLAEMDALQAENERLRVALDELLEALQAIVDEVSDGRIPYSSDSYLPAHLVEQARAALTKGGAVLASAVLTGSA